MRRRGFIGALAAAIAAPVSLAAATPPVKQPLRNPPRPYLRTKESFNPQTYTGDYRWINIPNPEYKNEYDQ